MSDECPTCGSVERIDNGEACARCGGDLNELATPPGSEMYERAFRAVRRRALTIFEEFEEDSNVTVKFVRQDDRLWALVRCDDDRVPTVIWNQHVVEGTKVVDYEIMEMWMDEKIRDAFLEFCAPNVKRSDDTDV